MPSGASQARTEDSLKKFENSIKNIKGIKSTVIISGMSMMSGSGENVGMCILALEDWDKRTTPDTQLNAIMGKIQAKTRMITDARIICFTPPAIMGLGATGGATFEICGIGSVNPQELSEIAKDFVMRLSAKSETLYAMTNYNADTPQLYLDINREKAETLGVSVNSIFSTLQSKLASLYINDFTMLGQNYKVKMQSPAEYRTTVNDIHDIQIENDNGKMVPLSSLAKLEYVVGPRQVTRFNKMTCAAVNAQAKPGISSENYLKLIESIKLPKNYHIEWTGLSFQEKQNEGQIVYLMVLALIFAYLFLVAQYESWLVPIPVMVSVSFAVLGALIGLKITGESMSIYAQLGMVMLIGLAGKNAILMVEFSKTEREKGKNIFDAAMSGANLRYRAVLMTAFSFIFGVFPLVIANGAGSGSRKAIGITTFSGMVLTTLIGIVFTPALYALFQYVREWLKKNFHSKVERS